MACCLFGAKPLPKSMMTYCQFDPYKLISVKFLSQLQSFIDNIAFEYVIRQSGHHFVSASMC